MHFLAPLSKYSVYNLRLHVNITLYLQQVLILTIRGNYNIDFTSQAHDISGGIDFYVSCSADYFEEIVAYIKYLYYTLLIRA